MLGYGFHNSKRKRMTKKQKDYIKKQLHIIQAKADEDELRRYEALLGGAKLDKTVKEYLISACTARRSEFNRISPLVAHGDIDDIN